MREMPGGAPGALLTLIAVFGCAGRAPEDLGVRDGRLAPCPDSPNCVSSAASDDRHAIAPLRLEADADRVWEEIARLLEATPRVRIVSRDERYLHAEFTTRLMRYVDDVELLRQPDGREIAVRSASRVGYGDMGANRKRIEWLRGELAERGLVRSAE